MYLCTSFLLNHREVAYYHVCIHNHGLQKNLHCNPTFHYDHPSSRMEKRCDIFVDIKFASSSCSINIASNNVVRLIILANILDYNCAFMSLIWRIWTRLLSRILHQIIRKGTTFYPDLSLLRFIFQCLALAKFAHVTPLKILMFPASYLLMDCLKHHIKVI